MWADSHETCRLPLCVRHRLMTVPYLKFSRVCRTLLHFQDVPLCAVSLSSQLEMWMSRLYHNEEHFILLKNNKLK